jgi:hypothetical protein
VLAGKNTLKYAIRLKKRGKIGRLTAGPNIVITSADYNGLAGSPEIDLYLVNSEWTKAAYIIDNPSLEGRVDIFPSGVDIDFWKINKIESSRLRLGFYHKRPEPNLYRECKRIAENQHAEVLDIFYGLHDHEQLKSVLATLDFVVYFVEQESQGIALAEIWATDTPTIVWNPGYWHYQNKNYACSSAPYLTSHTGAFFRDATTFLNLFEKGAFKTDVYTPREWILNNLTDEISASHFLNVIKPRHEDI